MTEQIVPSDVGIVFRTDVSVVAKMITDKMAEDVAEARSGETELIERVEAVNIQSQADYASAVEIQKEVKDKSSAVLKLCNNISDKLKVLHLSATAERSKIMKALESAGSTIAQKLEAWELKMIQEQNRINEEARKKAAADEERKRKRIEKQQEKARENGDEEKAEELEQKKQEVYTPIVAQVIMPGRVATASVKRSAKPDITISLSNPKLACKAIAEGKIPITAVSVNLAVVKRHFKAFETSPKEAAEMGFTVTDSVASRTTPKK